VGYKYSLTSLLFLNYEEQKSRVRETVPGREDDGGEGRKKSVRWCGLDHGSWCDLTRWEMK